MSLWRVKHSLSPIVEAALIAVVACYGFLAIFFDALKPHTVDMLSPIMAVRPAVSIAIDTWERHDDTVHRYAFAAPHGWIVDDRNPSAIRIGRFAKEAADAPEEEYSLLISSVPIQPRQQIENLAAADFAQARPAVYDVAMDGRPAMFAVAFENGRVSRQAVYVVLTPPSDASPGTALVIRAGRLDPAVFSTLVSTLRFYDQKPKTTP